MSGLKNFKLIELVMYEGGFAVRSSEVLDNECFYAMSGENTRQ
jgi:hypothetical protein